MSSEYQNFALSATSLKFSDSNIKTSEMLSFPPLMNNSVIIGLSFLLVFISVTISSNTINTFQKLIKQLKIITQKRKTIEKPNIVDIK